MLEFFTPGKYIRYGASGVCKIEAIERMASRVSGGDEDFFVLKPVLDERSTVYVPVDSEAARAKMRPVLTREEIDALIISSAKDDVSWECDRKERSETFRRALRDSEERELMRTISCIYLKKKQLLAEGKRLSASDEGVLKQAEKLIQSDFAFVLGITGESVGEYIRSLLELHEADGAEPVTQ